MGSSGDQFDFFAQSEKKAKRAYTPLAARMRPRDLSEVIGQDHLLGEAKLLPQLVKQNQFGSIILYGPPGCGKTSLAQVIARQTDCRFVSINAVSSNVAELREILKRARYEEQSTVVFVDEIHRFNKSQQDLLLPDVEEGVIRLIGATTHNPGFYVNAPLLSRSHLFRLEPVSASAVIKLLEKTLVDERSGLVNRQTVVEPEVLSHIARFADGDLRRGLNSLETLVLSVPMGETVTVATWEQFALERQIRYDAHEDEHYDTISAFIKSMRGGDPDAAIYWLAKMLEGGEDPRFIARRLVIFASEDIGLADSRALTLAMSTFQACEVIGLPECSLNLAHAVGFLATAPKSNSTYRAINEARAHIKSNGVQAVPQWLRDTGGAANKRLDHGVGYDYSHQFAHNISDQEYMLDPVQFYQPGESGAEAAIKERLLYWKKLKKEMARAKKA